MYRLLHVLVYEWFFLHLKENMDLLEKLHITFLLLIFLKFRSPPHCVLTETISVLNNKFEDSIKFYSDQDQSFFAWFKNINHGYATIYFLINTKSPLNCRLIFNCLLQLKTFYWRFGTSDMLDEWKSDISQQRNSPPSFPLWLKLSFKIHMRAT